ncbi:MAG: hypothetical protein M1133_07795 [Armatimonadetes bacterium]|nr:hypothetical protein [Armatimonadota bacterium]
MAHNYTELIETPAACEDTTEYENRIEENVEIDPEEEEQEDIYSSQTRVEIERRFAAYERNYRARRIRELTLAPLNRGRHGRKSAKVAA